MINRNKDDFTGFVIHDEGKIYVHAQNKAYHVFRIIKI